MYSGRALGLVPSREELHANFRILMMWRWVTGAGALVLAIAGSWMPDTGFQPAPLFAVGLVHLAFNLFLLWELRRPCAQLVVPAYLQIALDLVTLTAIFHFTGGVESPCTIYLVIHLFGTALILQGWGAASLACAATITTALIAWGEYQGIIPHVDVWGATGLYRNQWFAVTAVMAFMLTTLLLFSLGIAVASRLRRSEREAVALYQAARVITSSLDVNDVLGRLLEHCTQALKASSGIVRLLSADGRTLEFAAARGLSDHYVGKGAVNVNESAMDWQATRGETVLIEDVQDDDRFMYKEAVLAEHIRSGLVVPIPDANGHVLGVLRVYSDAPGHFTEADIPFLTAMTAQAGIALSNALKYQTLADIDEAKMRFLRTVTHELRAPVGAAQSLMSTLCQGYVGEMTPDQCDIVGRVSVRLDFLQELITDLLDLAAGKEIHLTHRPVERLNITEQLAEVCEHLRPQAEARTIALESNADITPELWTKANPEEARRVLINLIGNAIKYTREGGHVAANLTWNSAWLTLAIEDNGIGIPADDLPHIWDEFFRARNARERERQGTGLGLAIVRQLVEHYGGQISVASVENTGTTFTLRLPLLTVGARPAPQQQQPVAH